MGAIEAWGVGLYMIQEECEKAGIPQPTYEAVGDGVRVIFNSGPWSDTGEEVTKQSAIEGLTPLETEIYKMIAEGRYTIIEEAAKSLGSSTKTVYRATMKLSDMKLIRRVGSKKSGLWEPVSK